MRTLILWPTLTASILALSLAGCPGDDSSGTDTGCGTTCGTRDVGSSPDSGLAADVGHSSSDGATSSDAGSADAGGADVGRRDAQEVQPDVGATPADASLADTGTSADIGAMADTGALADAGASADTGAQADIGAQADAGSLADSGPTTRANGTLGAWQALPTMPVARANHCIAAVNGHVMLIGGNYKPSGSTNFVTLDSVHAAKARGDGSVDPWFLSGTTPGPVSQCTAVADGSTVYLVGGLFDDPNLDHDVYSTTVTAAGLIGTWNKIGTIPADLLPVATEAWVTGGSLYVACPTTDPTEHTLILHAPLGATLGAWVEDTIVDSYRGQAQYTFNGAFFHVLGGYLGPSQNNDSSADVSYAPLNADGTVGKGTSTTPLPSPIVAGEVAVVDDYLFLVGGKAAMLGANGVPDCWSAPVHSDGTVGAWTKQASLPQGRTNHEMVQVGDFLYQTGGGYTGPGLDTAYSARVRW